MISITTIIFDLDGDVIFRPGRYFIESDQGQFTRRISKTATFGGSDGYDVDVEDNGFSDGDREQSVTVSRPTAAEVAVIRNIQRNHNRVRVADESGCYEAGITSVIFAASGLSVTLSIYKRLSA